MVPPAAVSVPDVAVIAAEKVNIPEFYKRLSIRAAVFLLDCVRHICYH